MKKPSSYSSVLFMVQASSGKWKYPPATEAIEDVLAKNISKRVLYIIANDCNEFLLLTTDRHDGALVNYVTFYTPPNKSEMAEITLRQLKWILTRIFFLIKTH